MVVNQVFSEITHRIDRAGELMVDSDLFEISIKKRKLASTCDILIAHCALISRD